MRVTERELGAGLRGLYAGDRLRLGGYLEGTVRLIDAVGTTNDGESGSAHRDLPAVLFGAELRARLVGKLECRLALGAQFTLRHLHLAVRDSMLVDLGGVRLLGTLSLVMVAP